MPRKKTEPVPARPEPEEEPTSFRFKVTSDNLTLGDRNAVLTLPSDASTAALVEAGHLEPLSKAASDAVEGTEAP